MTGMPVVPALVYGAAHQMTVSVQDIDGEPSINTILNTLDGDPVTGLPVVPALVYGAAHQMTCTDNASLLELHNVNVLHSNLFKFVGNGHNTR